VFVPSCLSYRYTACVGVAVNVLTALLYLSVFDDMRHLSLHALHSVVTNRTVVAYLMVVATVRGPGRPEQARDRAATGREEARRTAPQGTVCALLLYAECD
jgi:hypothetical protein